MQAVIMAGGKGTRLKTVTNDCIAKAMAPVSGKPVIYWQVDELKKNGFKDIIVIVGYLKDTIIDFLGDGSSFGVRVRYITEAEPLGTAGSFFYLKDMLESDEFLLVFGDLMFSIDISRMTDYHRRKNSAATLFVHPNDHPYDSDLIRLDECGKVVDFDSKNNVRDYWYDNCVNAGFYILNSNICDKVESPHKVDLENDILFEMVKKGDDIFGYFSPEYIKDVGTRDRIRIAENHKNSGLIEMRNLKNPQSAVFLDRDGTINRKNGFIYREEMLELEECAAEAIRNINESGRLAIVITNQPAVARGLCEVEDIHKIHDKMKTLLGREGAILDDVLFCPHHPHAGFPGENQAYKKKCDCRKPGIQMIRECSERYNIDLGSSWIIGDATGDIMTGKNSGIRTALVLTGDAGNDEVYDVKADIVAKDLKEAVRRILEYSIV